MREPDWQTDDGAVQLYRGDCLEVMPTLDEAADAIICDLPYGTTANAWDTVIPLAPLWEAYKRGIKPKGAIVLFGSQPFTSALVMSNPKMYRHEWIWQKNRGSNFANTVREPFKEHESVIVFSQGGWTYNKQMQNRAVAGAVRVKTPIKSSTPSENYRVFNERPAAILPELRVPSSVQKFNCQVGLHPTQKPVALLEYLIRTYTNEGETVLDNTFGSGTTAVACINTGRRFIGIERDPKYFDVAVNRCKEALGTVGLFAVCGPRTACHPEQSAAPTV